MLTDRQVMWFDDGERSSLEDFYRDGNRGRPWGRLVALDTKRTRKVAETTGETAMEHTGEAGAVLSTMSDAEAILLTYVGMTALPEKRQWLSQAQIRELILRGDPVMEAAGRALFTVAADEHGYLYVVVSRFEVEDRKVIWGPRLSNVLTPLHIDGDEMLFPLVKAMEEGRKALQKFKDRVASVKGAAIPDDMQKAATAVAGAEVLVNMGLEVKMRYEEAYNPVRTILEEKGVTFYEESRG